MAKKKNEEVKKASEVLETISQDEKEQMHYLSRLMKQMDEESYYAYARKEGREEGEKIGQEKGEKSGEKKR